MEESVSLTQLFMEGGWTMWLIVLLTLGAGALTVAALIANSRVMAFVALGGVALIALTGVGGTMLGRQQVDAAIGFVDDAQGRGLVPEGGYREAGRNLQFAGIVGVPLLLLAVAAYARAMQKPS